MNEMLFTTVVELVRFGAVGFGAVIALLAFLMIVRPKPVEPAKAKLIEKFMKWGFAFGLVAGVFGLVPLLFDKSGPVPVRLAFSPDFATQGLSPPKIELPDGTTVKAGQKFVLEPSLTPQVVTVGVDQTLEEVKNLLQATVKLNATVKTVQGQRDALAQKIVPTSVVADNLNTTSAEAKQLQNAVTKSLATGDFAQANRLTTQLSTTVNKADQPVATITGPQFCMVSVLC